MQTTFRQSREMEASSCSPATHIEVRSAGSTTPCAAAGQPACQPPRQAQPVLLILPCSRLEGGCRRVGCTVGRGGPQLAGSRSRAQAGGSRGGSCSSPAALTMLVLPLAALV